MSREEWSENLAAQMEAALAEWGTDPVHIRKNWTREMLDTMLRKKSERIQKINEGNGSPSPEAEKVSGDEFLRCFGGIN